MTLRALLAVLLLGGCYLHAQRADAPLAPAVRPSLIAPMEGRYRLFRGGEMVGEERFTITASAARWRVAGESVTHGTPAIHHGYVFEVDAETAEPVAFELRLGILGLERRVRGRRAEGYLEVTADGVGAPLARRIPYAAGTAIDSVSPLFKTLVLSLLGPTLVEGQAVPVRTVMVSPPHFEPVVVLESFILRGVDAGVRRIELRGQGPMPTALWVRADGLPVRVRTFSASGEATEMVLMR